MDWLQKPEIWIGAGVLLVCLICLRFFLSRRRGKRKTDNQQGNLAISVEQLPLLPVVTEPYRIDIYGSPVRIRALVLAPIGRSFELPPNEQLGNLLNHFVPNFTSILQTHQPIIQQWPGQLSTSGFMHSFFNNLAIPNKGQGTAWCSIAGKIEIAGANYLIGMLCSTDSPNSLGEIPVEHTGQWVDILRVHQA